MHLSLLHLRFLVRHGLVTLFFEAPSLPFHLEGRLIELFHLFLELLLLALFVSHLSLIY